MNATKIWLRRATMCFGVGLVLTWTFMLAAISWEWAFYTGGLIGPVCWILGTVCLEKANTAEGHKGGLL